MEPVAVKAQGQGDRVDAQTRLVCPFGSFSHRQWPTRRADLNVALVALLALASLVVPLAVADTADAATGYGSTGAFGSGPGAGNGEFTGPGRIAVDEDNGNVYVVDRGNDRIQVFGPDGSAASFLTEVTGFDDPYGIAIDQSASPIAIYVSDAGANRIVKLVSDGAATPSFSDSPGFSSPLPGAGAGRLGSFMSPLAVDPKSGDLLVADTGKDLVQRFNSNGGFEFDINGEGAPDGPFVGLEDIASNSDGDIFVIDGPPGGPKGGQPSRLERYSSSGQHEATLRTLQNEGDGLLALDPDGDSLVVADVRDFSSRIHIVDQTTGERLAAAGVGAAEITGAAIDGSTTGRLYLATDDRFCGGGCGPIATLVFEPFELPTASVAPATGVGTQQATLHGTVNPNGTETTGRFELSSDGGSSWFPVGDGEPAPGNGTLPVEVSFTASGLQHSTDYMVRLVAVGPGGTTATPVGTESFTTGVIDAPAVTLDPSANVTAHSADLSGTIDGLGFDTTYRFELSSDGGASWTSIDPDIDGDESIPGTSIGPQAVSIGADQLSAGTIYDYRLVAISTGGESKEAGQFSTPAASPELTALDAADVRGTSARLRARILPNGSETTYHFEYGRTTSYGIAVPAAEEGEAGSGHRYVAVSNPVAGLEPGVTYHFRVVAKNATGSVEGPDQTFTTTTVCANAGIRAAQHSDYLPECRAYELVSPAADDSGVSVMREDNKASLDGNGLYFTAKTPLATPPSHAAPTLVGYRARRDAEEGWTTEAITPPYEQASSNSVTFGGGIYRGLSDDLTQGVFLSDDRRLTDAAGWQWDLYKTADADGPYLRLSPGTDPTADSLPDQWTAFVGGSADLGHLVVQTDTPVLPDAATGVQNLYEWVGDEVRLVNVLPADQGGGPAPLGGEALRPAGGALSDTHDLWNPVSDDGSKIFFTSGGIPYVRVDGEETYALTVEENDNADLAVAEGSFTGASEDGDVVTFGTVAPLVEEDTDTEGDLYLYDTTKPGDAPDNLQLVSGGEAIYTNGYGVGHSDQHGTTVYFQTYGRLRPDDPPSMVPGSLLHIYAWHNGEVTYVGQNDDTVGPMLMQEISKDGTKFAFLTPWMKEVPPEQRYFGAEPHHFVYDALSGEPSQCVTCDVSWDEVRIPPSFAGRFNYQSYSLGVSPRVRAELRNLSDDGELLFDTTASLSPQDVNGGLADVYSWKDGEARLISSGRGFDDHFLASTSESHDDIFVYTRDQLLPSDRDRAYDLYDARVGGGFAEAGIRPSCELEDCPDPPDISPTAEIAGSGNHQAPTRATPSACKKAKAAVARAKHALKLAKSERAEAKARSKLRDARRRAVKCRAALSNGNAGEAR
ncbi:MAG TPA: hypothetical protein VD761_05745 [Solirubrobacterales bacterium]|nr:hypothetical protein [Solirubrobacterales bacterium]